MSNNKIQIKRSVANATVTGLSNGELAYTQASNTFWIGLPDGTGAAAIGGVRNPGVLTANQALVANATSGIDKIITANAVVTTLWANGSGGSNGQVLVTNGSAVFWGTGTSGANTQVQFNDSGVANGVAGFTFDKTSNTLFIGNNVNSSIHSTGAGYGTATGGGIMNTSVIAIGNSSSNVLLTFANLTIGSMFTNGTYLTVSSLNGTTANLSTSLYVGSPLTGTGGLIANVTTIVVGNNTVNTTVTSAGLTVNGSAVVANSTGVWTTGTVNAASHTVGTVFVANTTTLNANGLVVNSTGAYVTGLVNSTSFNAGAIGTGTGGSVQNTTTVFVGNNTVNSVLTSAGLSVNGATIANNTGVWTTGTVNAASHTVGTTFIANSTKVTFTGANIDATSAFLKVADAVISGNLVVSGSVVSVNTQTLVVNDNIIELGDNNTTTDVVDTGWYSPAGNASAIWYSGIARIAASSTNTNPVFRVFVSNTNPNTATTIDTLYTSTGSIQAYLVPYGLGGAFVANGTNVTIAANSTLAVSITANTLTLATALAGTSGGTGKSTVTNNALLVGNSTNGYNELTLGTSGYVLQSNGTAWVADVLDGGNF